jgi:hypothetical protein
MPAAPLLRVRDVRFNAIISDNYCVNGIADQQVSVKECVRCLLDTHLSRWVRSAGIYTSVFFS